MKTLDKKWKIILYGCSGLGLNMINIIIGTHLCNAIIADGFDSNVEFWTYSEKTLVVVGIWAVLSVIVKAFDGLIDIPFFFVYGQSAYSLGTSPPGYSHGIYSASDFLRSVSFPAYL